MTTELIINEKYIPKITEIAENTVMVLRFIGVVNLYVEDYHCKGYVWNKNTFIENFKVVPKKKKKISRYRFTSKLDKHTWEENVYLTEDGRHSKDSAPCAYFDNQYYQRTKIGEEIDCPWEE